MPHNIGRNTGLSAHVGLQRARESALAAARRAATSLAARGQRGDRRLIHVDDEKLGAIRVAFGQGGAGRRNPVTGLEQFAPEQPDTDGAESGIAWEDSSPDNPVTEDDLTAAYHVLTGLSPGSQAGRSSTQLAQIPPLLFLEEPPVLIRPTVPYPKSPTEPPGPGWEWRGQPFSKPGDRFGSWRKADPKESLRPDLDHPPGVEPHWDWKAPDGNWYRWLPDGTLKLKT